MSGEAQFHTVTAPGLGAWRVSDPGVKAYRYIKQVTNLSAPASYRATVRFRWLNAKGRLICAAACGTRPGAGSRPRRSYPPSSSTEAISSIARMV